MDELPYFNEPKPLRPGLHCVRQALPADDEGLFSAARLTEVVEYLRWGKNLNLPKHWREGVSWPGR